MLFRGLFLTITINLIPTVRSHDLAVSRDATLTQYERYYSLGLFPKNLTDRYVELSNVCEAESSSLSRLFVRTSAMRDYLGNEYPSVLKSKWKRPSPRSARIAACKYSFSEVNGLLMVQQSNCTDQFAMLRGGSSFTAFAQGLVLEYCDIWDFFNNSYSVACHAHQELHRAAKDLRLAAVHEAERSLPRLCMNVSVLLDYESFDAFSLSDYLWDWQLIPLELPLVQNLKFCYEHNTEEHKESIEGKAVEHAKQHSKGFWLRDEGSAPGKFSYNWKWYHEHEVNITQCISSKEMFMVGESHMRYNYDYFISRVWGGHILKPLLRKHDGLQYTMGNGSITSKGSVFTKTVAPLLNDICSDVLARPRNVTVAFQTGNWDAAFIFGAEIIMNPLAGPAIIQSKLVKLS
jgi:hypothetical protein